MDTRPRTDVPCGARNDGVDRMRALHAMAALLPALLLTAGGCRCRPTSDLLPASDCAHWWGCAAYGLCTDRGSTCVATRTEDCRASWACAELGACAAIDDHCAAEGPAAEDCRRPRGRERVDWCATFGRCAVRQGACVVPIAGDADCHRPAVPGHDGSPCATEGRCRARDGRCVAVSEADCRASWICREEGLCAWEGDRCLAATDAMCRDAPACRDEGACAREHGLCFATDATCAATTRCRDHGTGCHAVRGACHVDLPFIYFQF